MKTAIVIGATSGIGREAARQLAAQGCRVGITGRRETLLQELAAEAPERYVSMAFDAAAPDAADRLEQLAASLGRVDLILFCAGTGDLNPALNEAIERRTNRVNVDAFTCVADWSYRYLLLQGGGCFAAVTSVMGLRGSGTAPAYAASKAYQISYLQGLQQRAAHESVPIRIIDIRPGSVDTAMMKGEGHFWISTPAQAAACLLRAIDRGKRIQYVTPRWKSVALVLHHMPDWLHRKM